MVAYTYQLSLFSTVVLLFICLLIVMTLINWAQKILSWLMGDNDQKYKVKVEQPKIDDQEDQEENEEMNEIPDLDQKKGL